MKFFVYKTVKCEIIKGTLSCLRQFSATEKPLKWWKILLIPPKKHFSFSRYLRLFGHVTKGLDKKDKTNFKFDDATAWLANNRNTNIARYFEK